jgi:hypothetical protein
MLLDVESVALEMGQSMKAKKVVKIKTCTGSLLILDAPFKRSVTI